MKSTRAPRFSQQTLVRALFALFALLALCVLGLTQLLGSTGCSSGAICYRNTDCPYASDCKQGTCVRRTSSEAGFAGSSSDDDATAGELDASQTPDAN